MQNRNTKMQLECVLFFVFVAFILSLLQFLFWFCLPYSELPGGEPTKIKGDYIS